MSTHQLATHDLVGQIVGRYQVEQVLGTGQTHVLSLARHRERNYPAVIAMYVLPETLSSQARCRFMARFAQVASKLVTLRHLHLVPMYDYGEYQGSPYVITAAGAKGSLAHVDPCPPRFAVHILKQIAEGLEYAHRHEIIHGALRPESLLFSTPQTVQVAGCGLRQLLALQGIEQRDHPYAHLLTIAGTFLGTPESVAPECVQGCMTDGRADVYGLGILLFQLLSGKPPFSGTDPFLTAMQHLQHPIPSLHALRPDLPQEIDQVMLQALARDPEQRYQQVSDLVVACSQILSDQQEQALPIETLGPLCQSISSSVHMRKKAASSAEKWQVVPPIITGQVPALGTQGTTPLFRGSFHQAPLAPGMPVQEQEVPLFDVRFLGLDHLQYTVRAHVARPQMQPGQGMVFPQPPQQVRILNQPEKTTDPIPAFPISASCQTDSGAEDSHSFLLRVVQPGLVGLMDGSVSTLAPIFATAFATHHPLTTFLVGMASATGAGISMAFAEALSDDGELTGRGNALLRGGITGLMTFLSGAGHTLPFLVPDIHLALLLAYIVVALELIAIAAIRHTFFNTRWWLSLLQVVGGGLLVFLAALVFGNG
jgi:serine/threonine protein kinase